VRAQSTTDNSNDQEKMGEALLHKHQPEMKCRSTRSLG
jgi:hypothetical protein